MDYLEAKYRTLWKLAFCAKGLGTHLEECWFCYVVKLRHPRVRNNSGECVEDCSKCPVDVLCTEYCEFKKLRERDWLYFFDQLLALEMPNLTHPEAT